MKLIIAGSRNCTKEDTDTAIILNKSIINDTTEIVSGMAKGPDSHGLIYAVENNLRFTIFPADWQKYGKSAGAKRNIQMGDYADELLAVWDGHSRGTKHMIDYMKKLGKPVHIWTKTLDSISKDLL